MDYKDYCLTQFYQHEHRSGRPQVCQTCSTTTDIVYVAVFIDIWNPVYFPSQKEAVMGGAESFLLKIKIKKQATTINL